MSSGLTYLITGAGRGIGKAFTAALLQRPSTTVIAAVRDPATATLLLNELPKANDSRLVIIKLDSRVETDAAVAVERLQAVHGITALDVVIANAGISHSGGPISQNSAEAIRDHFNINTIGPVLLFQATLPLLKSSKSGNPIFVPISSLLASIISQPPADAFPPVISPYGASKAALNWMVARIHLEEPWLTAFVFHPGLVKTDMTEAANISEEQARALGAITTDVSVSGMLKTIDGASRENSGTFVNYDGTRLPW